VENVGKEKAQKGAFLKGHMTPCDLYEFYFSNFDSDFNLKV